MPCFYKDTNGRVIGPISKAEARKLAAQQVIGRDTLLARTSEGPWVAADRLRGLFDALSEASPQPSGAARPTPPDAPVLHAGSPAIAPQDGALANATSPLRELAAKGAALARQHFALLGSIAGVACLILIGAVVFSAGGSKPAGNAPAQEFARDGETTRPSVTAEDIPASRSPSIASSPRSGATTRRRTSAATPLDLIPPESKAIGVVYPRVLFNTEFGKNNVRSMMATPSGQEGLRQMAEMEAKYGFVPFIHLTQLIIAAPMPRGELLTGLLAILEGEFDRARIEHVLVKFDGLPNEPHAGVNIFQSSGVNGSGQFYFAFVSDSLLVGSMELPAVRAAINRSISESSEQPVSATLAAAMESLPREKTAWIVFDPAAVTNQSPDIRDICDRTEWLSLSVDAMHPTGSLMATMAANSPRDADALASRFRAIFFQNANGEQMFRMLPGGIRPTSESIRVEQNGRRVVVSVSDLR